MSRTNTFPYLGSKSAHAPAIAALLPRDAGTYVEVFGGSAAVLHALPSRYPVEVYNDLDGGVVNFYRQLREAPDEVERLCSLTPYAREEFRRCVEEVDRGEGVEGARAFLYAQVAGFGGKPRKAADWTARKEPGRWRPYAVYWQRIVERIPVLAQRFRGVHVERMDALALVERYDGPGALFYLDPPYLPAVRSDVRRDDYRHELGRAGHVALAARLHRLKGRALISGYPSRLYERLFHGWEGRRIARPHAMVGNRRKDPARGEGERREEWVWANYPLPGEGG